MHSEKMKEKMCSAYEQSAREIEAILRYAWIA